MGKSSQRVYDPERLEELKQTQPPTPPYNGIQFINSSNQLDTAKTLFHPGAVCGVCWSPSGKLLASVGTLGMIRVWKEDIQTTTDNSTTIPTTNNDNDNTTSTSTTSPATHPTAGDGWVLWKSMRDRRERNEEFYTVKWTPDDRKLIVAGKKITKVNNFNINNNNNYISPTNINSSGTIKLFDLESEEVVLTLQGHKDEIFKLLAWTPFADRETNTAVYCDFLPGCGNKFFLVACDDGLKLFDFEMEQIVQEFPGLYGYLCDCVLAIEPIEFKTRPNEYYILTKGVEMLDENEIRM
ncbi:hypothetical protein HMI54_009668 [Coelomomyces lativittatus]|nr:hypothetical protein HMI54_009668 [Coelomomyces lativittatus]